MARRLVAIVGPTASGKSSLALELAQKLGGEIVNADSRQLYRGMDIGTAKPSIEERALVPHHLFDIADADETYSLVRYQRDARAALEAIWAKGTVVWLVGGTGQYVWSLLENWQVPEVPPHDDLRARMQAEVDEHGHEILYKRLQEVDPVAAQVIDARNVRRVIRALEVFEVSGIPISEAQKKSDPDFEFMMLGLSMPREQLITRINKRVERMFEDGVVLEARALLEAGVPPKASALSSIGYSESVRYLQKDIKRDKAIELTKRATKKLSRRQAQWFRKEDPRIRWVESFEEAVTAVGKFVGAPIPGPQ